MTGDHEKRTRKLLADLVAVERELSRLKAEARHLTTGDSAVYHGLWTAEQGVADAAHDLKDWL